MPLRFILVPVQCRQQDLKEFGITGILCSTPGSRRRTTADCALKQNRELFHQNLQRLFQNLFNRSRSCTIKLGQHLPDLRILVAQIYQC